MKIFDITVVLNGEGNICRYELNTEKACEWGRESNYFIDIGFRFNTIKMEEGSLFEYIKDVDARSWIRNGLTYNVRRK